MTLVPAKHFLSRSAFIMPRCSHLRLLTLQHQHQSRRSYALSRFPNRRATGVGRSRDPTTTTNLSRRRQGLDESQPLEDTPSGDESRMWHTSQRAPTSNFEEGLDKLLIQNDTLIIERQIEMLNIFVGFEQCNKYTISNEEGEPLGFIAEEDRGFIGAITRQAFATHRPLRAVVLDTSGSPILWLRRPFSWINSRMYVQRLRNLSDYTREGEPILDTFGEVQQIWHPWRRRYDLFLRECQKRILSLASEPQPEPEPAVFTQVAKIDAPFLAWDFQLSDGRGQDIALISRAFRGVGREIFTDTGRYSVCFKPVVLLPGGQGYVPQTSSRVLTLDERALYLALAINIDADYFSRRSHTGMGGLFHFSTWE
ncbi:Scramblase-domain-containing protein [Macrolepiota fuliginosa MF-IS2]|uniref:Phospholipid scramblase n=1 Tax=Macrolepiota fuliginosa MF-IS2 TaxID=1400762 RepID=A0A9P5XP49_9AGAR|nr:Scramblase-domain-containing protein [Macrolepiota fuliginosa MF-IS2]